MAKSPAFQFYASDFLTDTQSWDIKEVGIYIRLLANQWVNQSLPKDLKRLSRIAGCDLEDMEKAWVILGFKFIEDLEGNIFNKKLQETREEQMLFRIKQSKNGSKGGRPKKEKPNETQNKPKINPTQKPNESSSSSSSNKENNIKELTDNETLLFNDVCFYFGYFDVNFKNQRYLISCFIFSLRHKGKSEFFAKQFEFYKKLKQLDGYKHSLENFIGRQSEQFLDGKWDDNWEQKLKEFKIKNQTQNNSGRILN